ncbi:MAG: 16S rRNA (guanine(527)-N(7))-methyltransferase RsmG [Magnetococcus sp. XQGC-1]
MDQTEEHFSAEAWRDCFTRMEAVLRRPLSPEQQAELQQFSALLLQANRRFNLMGPSAEKDLLTRHLLDAVPLLPFFTPEARVADLGSGGGVPGLVLAILCHPPQTIHLIESIQKKARFLEQVVEQLRLGDRVRVFALRAERLGTAEKNTYDLVISRAVGTLAYGAELAWGLLRPGGAYLALKGHNHPLEVAEWQRSPLYRLYHPPQIHPTLEERGGVIVRLHKSGARSHALPGR